MVQRRIAILKNKIAFLKGLLVEHPRKRQIPPMMKLLDDILQREEMLWAQKSRINWLRWGDRNTRLFFISTLKRKTANRIKRIFTLDGSLLEDDNQIQECFLSSYRNLFTSSKPHRENINLVVDKIGRRLSQEAISMLDSPVTEDEIRRDLFEMAPLKALGPDEFPARFYQKY